MEKKRNKINSQVDSSSEPLKTNHIN